MLLNPYRFGGGPAYYNDFTDPGTLADFTQYDDSGSGTPAWSITGGQMSVVGGTAQQSNMMISSGPTFADGYVETTMTQSDQGGLILRMQPGGTQFYLMAARDASSSLVPNGIYLYYRNGGSYSTLGTGLIPGTWNRGTPKTFRLSAVGSTIKVDVDGVNVYTATDSSLSLSGKAGIYAYGVAVPSNFNDVTVQI